MKTFIAVILVFLLLSGCKKKANNENNSNQNSSSASFKIIPEYEQPYAASNVKSVKKLTVKSAVYIYIQHLKEELKWNKRITYMMKKKKFQQSHENSNSEGNNSEQSGTSPQNENNIYTNIDNETFKKFKKEYESIFFKKIGISRKQWERFSANNNPKIMKYMQEHPEVNKEIMKYSKLLREHQAMLNN